jgi:hypothetical protein
VSAREPVYALEADSRTQHGVDGPRESLSRHARRRARRLFRGRDARRREADGTARARGRDGRATARGFRLALDEPAVRRSRADRRPSSYDDDVVVGSGVITSAARH